MTGESVTIGIAVSRDVVAFVEQAIDAGDWRALESLATVVDTEAVHEAIEAAREVSRERPTDPGPEPKS